MRCASRPFSFATQARESRRSRRLLTCAIGRHVSENRSSLPRVALLRERVADVRGAIADLIESIRLFPPVEVAAERVHLPHPPPSDSALDWCASGFHPTRVRVAVAVIALPSAGRLRTTAIPTLARYSTRRMHAVRRESTGAAHFAPTGSPVGGKVNRVPRHWAARDTDTVDLGCDLGDDVCAPPECLMDDSSLGVLRTPTRTRICSTTQHNALYFKHEHSHDPLAHLRPRGCLVARSRVGSGCDVSGCP